MLNNLTELKTKIEDITSLLTSLKAESDQIEQDRLSLERSSYTATEREQRLNDREVILQQKERDIEAEKKYITEQNERNKNLLIKIEEERKYLVIDKMEYERLSRDKSYLETKQKELDEKMASFEKEKERIRKQDESTREYQTLLDARERRIKTREEALDKFERMTEI